MTYNKLHPLALPELLIEIFYLSDVAINTLISKNPNIIIPGWNPADINSESDSDANSELGISL